MVEGDLNLSEEGNGVEIDYDIINAAIGDE